MNGKKLYQNALILAGYSEDERNADYFDSTHKNVFYFINSILSEIGVSPIEDISSKIDMPENLYPIAEYGTAMLISFDKGDYDRYDFLSKIYSAKRTAAISQNTQRKNVI